MIEASRRRRQPLEAHERGDVGQALRRLPARGILGQGHPSPLEPRRRPSGQPRALAHRDHPHVLSRRDQGLRRKAHQRGKVQERDRARPKALRRQGGLSTPAPAIAVRGGGLGPRLPAAASNAGLRSTCQPATPSFIDLVVVTARWPNKSLPSTSRVAHSCRASMHHTDAKPPLDIHRRFDQVMASLELLGEVDFDPSAFAGFLASQPDLGTKWAPRFVRIVEAMPLTGTGKLDKRPLRAQGWTTADRVWWRPPELDRDRGRVASSFRRLTPEDVELLRSEFEANGRARLLDLPS